MGLLLSSGCTNNEPALINNVDCRRLIFEKGYENLKFYFEKEYKSNGKQWIVLKILGSDISAFGTFNFPDSTTMKKLYNNAGLRGARLIKPKFDCVIADSSIYIQLLSYDGVVD